MPLPLQTTAFNTLYQLNIANVCGSREPKRLSESADSVAIGRLRLKQRQLNTKKIELNPKLGAEIKYIGAYPQLSSTSIYGRRCKQLNVRIYLTPTKYKTT